MKRLVGAVVVSLVVIGTFAAGAVSAPQRVRAPQRARTASVPLLKAVPELRAMTSQPRGIPRRCRTLKCVNKKANLALRELSFFFSCTNLQGVTEFNGYRYDNGGGTEVNATAIDFDTLSIADEAHINWTCGR